jgi:hypothetical protein
MLPVSKVVFGYQNILDRGRKILRQGRYHGGKMEAKDYVDQIMSDCHTLTSSQPLPRRKKCLNSRKGKAQTIMICMCRRRIKQVLYKIVKLM